MKNFKLFLLGAAGLLFSANEASAQIQFNSTVNSGTDASAIGKYSQATGTTSFASGYGAYASGNYTTTLGVKSEAIGNFSTVIGNYNRAKGTRSFVLGSYAETEIDAIEGVAIGVKILAKANRSMIIGTGYFERGGGTPVALINNIENSLMVGFRSNRPSLFVGPSAGPGTTGRVGIGTTNTPTIIGGQNISNYRLFVAGGILTEEVRVRTGWADYVFEENYELPSLNEVSEYIEENGHLPNVPSAEQVEEEGIELGDITRIQQEKIEELTLYMIEMQKEIESLKARLDEQDK